MATNRYKLSLLPKKSTGEKKPLRSGIGVDPMASQAGMTPRSDPVAIP